MKRTMNKIQKSYMTAKARVQEVESQQEAIEKKYIADNGIVNPDGSVPEFLYCMDDDAAFEKANDECAALIAAAGLEAALLSARSDLKAAEDRLIAYGLSLAPAGVRATLEGAVQRNAATRAKVLDLAFRLDVSTVCSRKEGAFVMGVRKSVNRYRTTPSGYDYSDVLKRGKRFHRHSNFEMQPHTFSGRVFWSAESITLPPFVPPNGTVRIVWNGKRWSESPI